MRWCYWRKSEGEWAVIGPVEQIATGKVTVFRRDGRRKEVTIKRMSPPFVERNTDRRDWLRGHGVGRAEW